jgi:hypothetical protein
MSGQIPSPADYDREAEIADRRYAQALDRISVSDVLATVDAMIAEQPDPRQHPLYRLAAHVLRHGSYKRSGRPIYFSESVIRALEDVCDEAVERLIVEQLAYDEWVDLALDLE